MTLGVNYAPPKLQRETSKQKFTLGAKFCYAKIIVNAKPKVENICYRKNNHKTLGAEIVTTKIIMLSLIQKVKVSHCK